MKPNLDVLIIGAGAIGLCTAYYLNQRGLKVAVVDRHRVGGSHSSSFGNTGHVGPGGVIPLAVPGAIRKGLSWSFDRRSPFAIRLRPDRAMFRWLWLFQKSCNRQQVVRGSRALSDLKRDCLDLFQAIQDTIGRPFGFTRCGKLIVYASERGFADARKFARLVRGYGVKINELTPGDVQGLQPGVALNTVGALHFEDDGFIDPAAFLQAMADYLRKQGTEVCSESEICDFTTDGDHIKSVRTTAGELSATEVVIAAGAMSGGLAKKLGLRLPLLPGKGYTITVKRPENAPSMHMQFAEGQVALTPYDDKIRFGGTLELGAIDRKIDRYRLDGIIKTVHRYLPELPSTSAPDVWAGLRPCTPDGLPFIGRTRLCRNLTFACGHGMIGIGMAPPTGKLIAKIITDTGVDIDLAPISPDRFRSL